MRGRGKWNAVDTCGPRRLRFSRYCCSCKDLDGGARHHGQGLKVGDELLSWGAAWGIPTLDYKGATVVSSTNSYVKPPFTILDRWKSAETDAVLLKAGQTATKDCSFFHVVESRKPGSVTAHELGQSCVGFARRTLDRNEDGFAFAVSLRRRGQGS